MVPGDSCYSDATGVELPPMPAALNSLTICSKYSATIVQARQEILVNKHENSINTKMDDWIMSFEIWIFKLSIASEPRHRDYRTARSYAIKANHSVVHTLMTFPPPNVPM